MNDAWYDDPDAPPPALGSVVETGRGSLPFALIHGEALVACASWALGDSGVTPVDLGTEWAGLVDAEEPFVLHDALCPMTPASFIARCVRLCVDEDVVVVGVLPGGPAGLADPAAGGGSADPAASPRVASPVVLPAAVVAELGSVPSLDFDVLVSALVGRFPVTFLEAPPAARRVTSGDDVRALEQETAP